MLAAIQSAHRNLEQAIAGLEALIGNDAPDTAALSSARFRLSRASLARRQVAQQAQQHIAGRASAAELAALRSLQDAEMQYVQASTRHVQRWSTAAAMADWAGFREESRAMRARMRRAIEAEQRLLYPLLARHSQR